MKIEIERIKPQALQIKKNAYFCPVIFAGVAQLVEHDLAKVGVASSSLVSRSKIDKRK